MAFQRKTWTDRLVETPNRRKLINVDTEEEIIVDISREEGEVFAVGDKFDEANMNNLELRIKEGFDTLPAVAKTGSYNDLIDKPESMPANGGSADEIKGIGDAEAIKDLIAQGGGSSFQQVGYEEGEDRYYEDPFHIRYKGVNGEVPEQFPMIAKYRDVGNSIAASIIFKDDGMEFFNAKIQPTETVFYTDNIEKSGFTTTYEDGSTISAKAVFTLGVFQGFLFNNGKMWKIKHANGDMPEIL